MNNSVDFLEWFEPVPPVDKRYNRFARERVSGRAIGIVGGKFYFPDFIVTVRYYTDPKTGKLADDWKALCQPDGLVMSKITFRRDTMVKQTNTNNQTLYFEIEMNVVFLDIKVTATLKAGNEKIGGELSAEGQVPQIYSTVIITGYLNANTGLLTVTGKKF